MFLVVLAHPGSPGLRAVKRLCVCVFGLDTVHITPSKRTLVFLPNVSARA